MTDQFNLPPSKAHATRLGERFKLLYPALQRRAELAARRAHLNGRLGRIKRPAMQVSLSCGLPAFAPAAIPGWFSSSLLPPSFARGRRTTVFIEHAAAGGRA
jgi:hypothetical protein